MHRNFNQKIFASGGSGKSYVLDTVYKDTKAKYGLLYDSVMKSDKGNKKLLEQVASAGHRPFIAAVITPIDIAAIQNLRRSVKQTVRRLVPIKVLSGGHFGFQQTFAAETVELAKELGVEIRYIFNDGKTTPSDMTFEEYKAAVYNNSADIENIIRTTSYEELEKNPLGLNYDSRTNEALNGNPIEEIDTRTHSGERGIDGSNSRSNEGGNSEGKRGTAARPPNSDTESAEKLDSPVGNAPPKDKPITLVFGGSYSPIHTGHIDAALAAVKTAEAQGYTVERILIAPSADTLLQAKNAKKGTPEDFIPLSNRAAMARMMVSELGHNIEVSEEPAIDAENFKPTKEEPKLKRTQLANWARKKYPETTIVNVSGADQIKDMQESGAPPPDALPAMFSGTKGSHEGHFYLGMPRDEESSDNKSSSAVHKSLKEGKGVPAGYMTPGAEQYYLGLVNKQNTETSLVDKDTNYGSVENPNTANLARAFAQHFNAKNGFTGIVEARKFAANLLGGKIETGSAITKEIDEAVEVGVVLAARKIVELARAFKRTDAETYQDLLDLYNRQPNLSSRTSTSIAQQAYSTPAPLAFIASRLAAINENTSVYEPTAGNGMLLIEANINERKVFANELNKDRANNLRLVLQAGAVVTTRDATLPNPSVPKVDVVIENPPFGVVKDENEVTKTFQINDQYATNEIDHAIVFKSLEAMKDSGSAVLIVGGIQGTDEVRSDKYNKGAKRKFYYSLYNEYNVVDHFTVDGALYAKQGAGYPVDVIVIRGRGQSNLELPAATVPLF